MTDENHDDENDKPTFDDVSRDRPICVYRYPRTTKAKLFINSVIEAGPDSRNSKTKRENQTTSYRQKTLDPSKSSCTRLTSKEG